MKLPNLHSKDTVLVVAPAGALTPEDIEPGLQRIKEAGYNYELGKNLFKEHLLEYRYAGTEEERLADMQWAFDHPTAKAIWCARGGYGGVHLVDKIDLTEFKKHPKWLIGYSDNTVFHQFLNKNKIPSIHGVTLKELPPGNSQDCYDTIQSILEHKPLKYHIEPNPFNTLGETSGILTGGNLSIIYSLIGSQTIDNFKNKILFIEDWYENWYHIDRMLMNMDRIGILKEIKGLIVGGMTKMDVKEENSNYNEPFDPMAYKVVANRFKDYNYPKCFGFPSGHISDNFALIMGGEIKMKIAESQCLIEVQCFVAK